MFCIILWNNNNKQMKQQFISQQNSKMKTGFSMKRNFDSSRQFETHQFSLQSSKKQFVQYCKQKQIQPFYIIQILKSIQLLPALAQLEYLRKQKLKLHNKQSYYFNIKKVIKSRSNCIQKLKDYIKHPIESNDELKLICNMISHLRLLSLLLIESIQKWRQQIIEIKSTKYYQNKTLIMLRNHTNNNESSIPIYLYKEKNILNLMQMDSSFLCLSFLRKFITFTRIDPLFLYPYHLIQNNLDYNMKNYNCVVDLFTLDKNMLKRLMNAQKILEEQTLIKSETNQQTRLDIISTKKQNFGKRQQNSLPIIRKQSNQMKKLIKQQYSDNETTNRDTNNKFNLSLQLNHKSNTIDRKFERVNSVVVERSYHNTLEPTQFLGRFNKTKINYKQSRFKTKISLYNPRQQIGCNTNIQTKQIQINTDQVKWLHNQIIIPPQISSINNQNNKIKKQKNIFELNYDFKIMGKNLSTLNFFQYFTRFYQYFTQNQLNQLKEIISNQQKSYFPFYIHQIKHQKSISAFAVTTLQRNQTPRTLQICLFKNLLDNTQLIDLLNTYLDYLWSIDPCQQIRYIYHRKDEGNQILKKTLIQLGFNQKITTPFSVMINQKCLSLKRGDKQCQNDLQQISLLELKLSCLTCNYINNKSCIQKQQQTFEKFDHKTNFNGYMIWQILQQHKYFNKNNIANQLIYANVKKLNVNHSEFSTISQLNAYIQSKSEIPFDSRFPGKNLLLSEMSYYDSFDFEYLLSENQIIFQIDNKKCFNGHKQDFNFILVRMKKQYDSLFIIFIRNQKNLELEGDFQGQWFQTFVQNIYDSKFLKSNIVRIPFFTKKLSGKILDIDNNLSIFGNCILNFKLTQYLPGCKRPDLSTTVTVFDSFIFGVIQRQSNKKFKPIFCTKINKKHLI